MVYSIARDGTVAYKSDWTDAHEIDGMCASLLRLDEMKARKVPIIRQGVSEIALDTDGSGAARKCLPALGRESDAGLLQGEGKLALCGRCRERVVIVRRH